MNKRIEMTINEARDKGISHISTCDAPNWNREEHDGMLMLVRNQPDDVEVTFEKNHGVWDWSLIRIGEKKTNQCHIHDEKDPDCYLCYPNQRPKDYTLSIDFEALKAQKQGLLAILSDDNNKEAVEAAGLDGILHLLDEIQDQAADKHGVPEKEVFHLSDEDEHSPQAVLEDRDLRVYDRNHVVHLIDKARIETFDAYQHFLYYIDINHLRANSPWDAHMTNHLLDKLEGFITRTGEGYIRIDAVVKWIQEISHHHQDALIVYMLKYHSGKGGGFRSWK